MTCTVAASGFTSPSSPVTYGHQHLLVHRNRRVGEPQYYYRYSLQLVPLSTLIVIARSHGTVTGDRKNRRFWPEAGPPLGLLTLLGHLVSARLCFLTVTSALERCDQARPTTETSPTDWPSSPTTRANACYRLVLQTIRDIAHHSRCQSATRVKTKVVPEMFC